MCFKIRDENGVELLLLTMSLKIVEASFLRSCGLFECPHHDLFFESKQRSANVNKIQSKTFKRSDCNYNYKISMS